MKTYAIANPVGGLSLVGAVPIALEYSGFDDEFVAALKQCGPRIAEMGAARRGCPVERLTWTDLDELVAAGAAIGVEVIPA